MSSRIQVEFEDNNLALTRVDDSGVKITTSFKFGTTKTLAAQTLFGKFDIFLEEHALHHILWETTLLVPETSDVQYCYFAGERSSMKQWVLHESRLTDGVADTQEACS